MDESEANPRPKELMQAERKRTHINSGGGKEERRGRTPEAEWEAELTGQHACVAWREEVTEGDLRVTLAGKVGKWETTHQ